MIRAGKMETGMDRPVDSCYIGLAGSVKKRAAAKLVEKRSLGFSYRGIINKINLLCQEN